MTARSTCRPVDPIAYARSAGAVALLLLAALASGCTASTVLLGAGDPVPDVNQDGGTHEHDGGADDGDAGPDAHNGASPHYEAENRTAQSGCRVASDMPGFTGSGFVTFGGSGTWIEWNHVEVALAGQYTLKFRYAYAGSDAPPFIVSVNGVESTAEFVNHEAEPPWSSLSSTVLLQRGNNTVRVTANGNPIALHLDHLALVPNDLCPSDASKTEPGECGCGMVEGSCVPPSPSAIHLPIEVLGPAGTSETIQVQVDDPANVTHLYVRCNSCGYHDQLLDSDPAKVKATVRVNAGESIALKHYVSGTKVVGNAGIEVIGAEANYGGIGGAFRTVRFKVPVTGLVAGMNTLTFEHVNAAPPSIGFRILEVNLLRGNSLSDRVLAESDFLRDDPSSWTPPLANASDISAGEALWYERGSLYDPGLDAIDGVVGRAGALNGSMVASCSDCHASDGRDLAYFNFSNHSIIERSYFHGLSREDGRRIASYIRSLKLPFVGAARPWNPPYQPGPGLDSRPVYEWAAGAGVDAILDSDAEMGPYLFPQGDALSAVRAVVDRYATLNLRELPVSLPMPEWNQWLPIIHPDDVFNTQSAAVRSNYNGTDVGKPYYQRLYDAARANPTPATLGAITIDVTRWLRRDMTCSSNGPGSGAPMRGLNGAVLSAIKLPVPTNITTANCNETRSRQQDEPFELAKRALTGWMSVKQWEIVHSNDLETKSATMTTPVCSVGRCIDASEPRGWVVDGRNVFDRAPHFVAHNSRNFFTQDLVTGVMETNAWYHLNMILNPGYRRSMPSHFAYVYTHVEILQSASGQDQGFRFWASLIKQRQLQTNGVYGKEVGLDLRTAQPYIYYSARDGRIDAQSSVGQPLWGRLAQAMLEDFVSDANQATAQDWANAVNNSVVQPRESTEFSVCTSCFDSGSRTAPFDLGALQGRNTYRVIPKLRQIGVAPTAVTELIDWCEKTWPNANWAALR